MPCWAEVKSGWKSKSVGWFDERKLVCVGLILIRNIPKTKWSLFYLPEGPVLDPDYAKNVVSEDIVHVKTKMGLIGIRIRIANKEKIIPEFKLEETLKPETEETKEVEQKDVAKTESEQIKIEGEKMKSLVTLEEEEQRLK